MCQKTNETRNNLLDHVSEEYMNVKLWVRLAIELEGHST